MSERLSPEFRAFLEAQGAATVDAIVRVSGDLDERAQALTRRGLQVRRTLRLIHALAVTGPAHTLLALAREPWVRRVEPDQPVHTLSTEAPP